MRGKRELNRWEGEDEKVMTERIDEVGRARQDEWAKLWAQWAEKKGMRGQEGLQQVVRAAGNQVSDGTHLAYQSEGRDTGQTGTQVGSKHR